MTVLRWGFLAILVAVMMSLQATAPGPVAAAPGEAPNPGLRMQARYAIGMQRLSARTGDGLEKAQLRELLSGCVNEAVSPRDRVRIVPLAAELGDVEEIEQRLEEAREQEGLTDEQRLDLDVLQRIYRGGGMTDEGRTRLVERHRWFGRLAVTWALPENNAERRAVRDEAVKAAAGLAGLTLLAIVGLVLGVTFLVVATLRWKAGRITFAYARPAPDPRDGIWLDTVNFFFAVMLGLGLIGISGWLSLGILAAATLLPVLGVGWAGWREGAGWHLGSGPLREFGRGIMGYVCGLPLVGIGMLISVWLAGLAGTEMSHPVVDEAGRGEWRLIFLSAALWAPLVEETLFRGVFYRFLRARWSVLGSALFTGFVFAAVHPQGWVGIPMLMSLGAWFAVLREWRGSIIASVTAHALHNSLLVTTLYLVVG